MEDGLCSEGSELSSCGPGPMSSLGVRCLAAIVIGALAAGRVERDDREAVGGEEDVKLGNSDEENGLSEPNVGANIDTVAYCVYYVL